MRTLLVPFVFVGLLLPASVAAREAADDDAVGAESYSLPEFMRQPPALPEAAGGEPMQLLLRDAVTRSVQDNLGVRLERDRTADRVAALMVSHGSFEPVLSLSYDHINGRSPPSSSVDGAADDLFLTGFDGLTVGLSQALPSATELGLSFSTRRTSSALGTAVEPLVVRDSLLLTLRQPLLRGFGFDVRVPNAGVLRAKLSSEQSAQELAVRMAETVRTTEDLYWDLVLTLKAREVQSGSLRLAEEQLALTRRQIDSGVLPPSDLIQAESTLAQRQLSMVRSTAAIGAARDRLWVVLGAAKEAAGQPILPLEAPTFEEGTSDLAAAIEAAQCIRPELLQLRSEVRRAKLGVAVATNGLLPELSIDLGVGVVGQDSTPGAAARKLSTFEARTFSAGVQFSWSPVMRSGLGGLHQAQASRRMADTRLQQLHVEVEVEVRTAHRALETASLQVRAAARFRTFAERSLEVEQRRFLDGISSNFLVAQRQDELAQAQLAELSALIAHRKARTGWELSTGELLAQRGIVVES